MAHSFLKTQTVFTWFLKIVCGAIIVYVLSGVWLYTFQEKLLFATQSISHERLARLRSAHTYIEEINLSMKDGTKLHGWFLKSKTGPQSKVLLYFGGNGDEVSTLIDEARRPQDWSIVLINYRGYGLSEGTPGEQKLYSDALEIYDYFANRTDVDHTKIVVMGRSLGSGIATYLAEKRTITGLILATPYDSMVSVAQNQYPLYPVNLLLKHKFDSLSRAPSITTPALFLIASEDMIIPPWHARLLAKKWGGPVINEEIQGAGHNSIVNRSEYWTIIGAFLNTF